jgi:geranylgeranyl pyrophosphate synthase
LGKTAGKDAEQNKITFPAVYGLEKSQEMAEQQRQLAHLSLEPFGERARRLHELADLIVERRS